MRKSEQITNQTEKHCFCWGFFLDFRRVYSSSMIIIIIKKKNKKTYYITISTILVIQFFSLNINRVIPTSSPFVSSMDDVEGCCCCPLCSGLGAIGSCFDEVLQLRHIFPRVQESLNSEFLKAAKAYNVLESLVGVGPCKSHSVLEQQCIGQGQ